MTITAPPSPKSTGLMFKSPLVRAILSGQKTQTRRIFCVQPPTNIPPGYYLDAYNGGPIWCWWTPDGREANSLPGIRCPFGRVGDSIYAKEKFYVAIPYSWGTDPTGEPIEIRGVAHGPVHYAADGPPANTPNNHYPGGLRGGAFSAPDPYALWRPYSSMFMPRRASRIYCALTAIRAERVQSITEDDAIAEGVVASANYSARDHFICLWNEINGKRLGCGFEVNPYVWVISFCRLASGGQR